MFLQMVSEAPQVTALKPCTMQSLSVAGLAPHTCKSGQIGTGWHTLAGERTERGARRGSLLTAAGVAMAVTGGGDGCDRGGDGCDRGGDGCDRGRRWL